MTAPARPATELLSIQYLRAIAAMLIVLYHLHLHFARMGHDGYWPAWLASGVDIFFVISGCIMWITTDERPPTPARFYLKRIVRIVPLYWLLTSFVVLVMLVSPTSLQSLRFELPHVLASYAFLPWTHPVTGLPEPALIPGWTLNYEMFFYAVFGAALPLPPARRLAVVATLLTGLVALGAVLPAGPTAWSFYSAGIMMEFALGMGIGRLAVLGRLPSPPLAWTALVAGLLAIPLATAWGPGLPRLAVWGLPAAAIVLGALSLDRAGGIPSLALPRILGDASYSIYLSHGIVLAAIARLWTQLAPSGSTAGVVMFGVVATAAATAAGVVLFLAVERPLVRRLRPSAAGR